MSTPTDQSEETSVVEKVTVQNPRTGEPVVPAKEYRIDKGNMGPRLDTSDEFKAPGYGRVYTTNLEQSYGEWRSVPGFPENVVLVSSKGHTLVRNSRSGEWGRPNLGWNQRGYFWCQIRKRVYPVGRLVCRAFHGPPPPKKEVVLYPFGDKFNNEYEGLRWGSRAEARYGEGYLEELGSQPNPVLIHNRWWGPASPAVRFETLKAAADFIGVGVDAVHRAGTRSVTLYNHKWALSGDMQHWSVELLEKKAADDFNGRTYPKHDKGHKRKQDANVGRAVAPRLADAQSQPESPVNTTCSA